MTAEKHQIIGEKKPTSRHLRIGGLKVRTNILRYITRTVHMGMDSFRFRLWSSTLNLVMQRPPPRRSLDRRSVSSIAMFRCTNFQKARLKITCLSNNCVVIANSC